MKKIIHDKSYNHFPGGRRWTESFHTWPLTFIKTLGSLGCTLCTEERPWSHLCEWPPSLVLSSNQMDVCHRPQHLQWGSIRLPALYLTLDILLRDRTKTQGADGPQNRLSVRRVKKQIHFCLYWRNQTLSLCQMGQDPTIYHWAEDARYKKEHVQGVKYTYTYVCVFYIYLYKIYTHVYVKQYVNTLY